MSEEIEKLKRIVAIANSEGFSASLEYPGFIMVVDDEGNFVNFGFTNGPFGYDRHTEEHEFLDCGESDLNQDASDEDLAKYLGEVCRSKHS